jgi:hypothetical protein
MGWKFRCAHSYVVVCVYRKMPELALCGVHSSVVLKGSA